MHSSYKHLRPVVEAFLEKLSTEDLKDLFRKQMENSVKDSVEYNYHRDCYYCLIYDTRTGTHGELIEILYYLGYRPDLEEPDIYKKPGASNIQLYSNTTHLDLTKRLVEAETYHLTKWNKVEDSLPRAYETGKWDGKRSDQVLVQLKDNIICVGVFYEGVIDGNKFQDWFNINDEGEEWGQIKPLYWKYIH